MLLLLDIQTKTLVSLCLTIYLFKDAVFWNKQTNKQTEKSFIDINKREATKTKKYTCLNVYLICILKYRLRKNRAKTKRHKTKKKKRTRADVWFSKRRDSGMKQCSFLFQLENIYKSRNQPTRHKNNISMCYYVMIFRAHKISNKWSLSQNDTHTHTCLMFLFCF